VKVCNEQLTGKMNSEFALVLARTDKPYFLPNKNRHIYCVRVRVSVRVWVMCRDSGAHIRGGVGGCDTPPCFVKYI
jgi:hypothetical protein